MNLSEFPCPVCKRVASYYIEVSMWGDPKLFEDSEERGLLIIQPCGCEFEFSPQAKSEVLPHAERRPEVQLPNKRMASAPKSEGIRPGRR